jgi:hypothetical protein
MTRPKELQMMIWERVPQQPFCVSIRRIIQEGDSSPPVVTLSYHPPPLLRTCWDARREALTCYELAFGAYLSQPVYFNYDIDFLEIDHDIFPYLYGRSMYRPYTEIDLVRVKNLMFVADEHRQTIDPAMLQSLCRVFSNLKQLRIQEKDRNSEMPHSGLPYTYQPHESSFRHNWSIIGPAVLRILPYIRGRIEEWTPPRLTIGTTTQWARLSHWLRQRNEKKALADGEMDWEPNLNIAKLDYTPLYGRSA